MANLSDKVAIAAAQNIKERDFWLDNLAGELKPSFFPYDFDDHQRKMETLDCELPGDTGTGLLKLSSGVDVKLHMILIAVLNILLNKYTYEKNDDILVGSPALKQTSEKEFINTFLVFRNRLTPRLTFKQLLLQVRETIVAATRHQNYPLLLLDFPLFDAALLVENIHDKNYLAGVDYNILFSFNRTPGGITARLEYNAARYRPGTVQQVFNRFARVLEQVLADLDTPIAALDILTGDDKKRFLDLNAAAAEYPKEKTLHQLFEEQVQRTPDRIALIAHFNNHKSYKTHMTYNQLDREANHLARQLPNAITGLLLEPSVEMFIGILGILKAGGAYLPIEPDYPRERIDFMLADSGAELLLSARRAGCVESAPCPARPASVIYTSGSTGTPKGVAVEHRNVVANIHSFYREFELTSRDTVIQLTSYAFDAFIEEVFPLLLRGGKVVIPGGRELMDIRDIAVFIARHCVTFIDTTPLLLNELNQLNPADLDLLKTVHTFISGGDVLKPGYVDRLATVGTVYNTYGPTEATVCASYYRYLPEAGVVSIPIGKPITNYGIYIMGSAGNLLPPGVPGELCITGPGVTRGYLNRPDLTNQKFLEVQEPFLKKVLGRRRPRGAGDLLYCTGDLGRWLNSGTIEFLGRVDSQVKIRGFRIELGEIESRLVSHPRVESAVVIAKGADEGEQYLCAYIVSDERPGKAELKEYLGCVLPHYMVPAFFVMLERLPLMANGKLDKAALPEVEIDGGARDAAPRDHVERQLAAIWAKTLKVENIGINSDFFDLGGSSLKAIGMISRVHRQMNVKLPLTEVFRVPTIRALARLIEDSAGDDYAAIEPAPQMDYYPLSSAQKRLYILQQLEPELTVYNMPMVFTMFTDGGEPDIERLERTFKKLIQRHECLRTSFIMHDGHPVQRIHDHAPFKIETPTIINDFIRSFDLAAAPLMRMGILSGENPLLMVDMHHIISDGVSHGILIADFFALYNGEELPALPLRYRDYAVWQHSEAQQEALKRQEQYWLDQLAGDLPVLELPIDRPRPEIRQFEGSVTGFTIGEAETGALKALARREDVTLHMLMLAVFYVWLSKLGRLEDIIIGIPTAGRRHTDLENIIGVFINTLAVRSRPTGEKEFTVFLREVKQVLLEAYENQEYPFEDL
ncbi:MAG: AMP-binding protein, partial [bacterium]|nr:AMP-binding protein [bacterium]